MSYHLLSEPIRRYIHDKRWEELRSIQKAAIERILGTEDNYILASRTASGKTEAAFLPILTRVNFEEAGVQVLYVSPLIALINDQFYRIEDLCKYIDVKVTKWHGEANKADKERLLKKPNGILLITPESIEAMLVNHPYNAKALFSNLKFIVIDEIHSFLGTDRGLHLKSLLSRISRLQKIPPRIIGLSATIGDYNYKEAKRFVGDEEKTKVLLDKTTKEIDAYFSFVKCEKNVYPIKFLEELYEKTKNNKVLIFPNSRGKAEEIAVGLSKIAKAKNGHQFYFSHHSSIDKDLRTHIEEFAKNNIHQPFCIVCTSTLELGIDIGSVDLVAQVDAPHSIVSLVQRVGRSGRKEGMSSMLLLYATDEWELLQSYACWVLYQSGFIEPQIISARPFDMLFHQMLSILKEKSGLTKVELLSQIQSNQTFSGVDTSQIEELIQDMVDADYIEDLKRELIVGIEGEKLTSSREFYSMFSTDTMFKVLHAGRPIGEVPFSLLIQIDENILLAARIWKITDIDEKACKIMVAPTFDGKKPLFFGEGANVHPTVRQQMLALIYANEIPPEFDQASVAAMNNLKYAFKHIPIKNLTHDRPFIVKEKCIELYTFTGTQINHTIAFLLKSLEIKFYLNDKKSLFEIDSTTHLPNEIVNMVSEALLNIDKYVHKILNEVPDYFPLNKWGKLLPLSFKKVLILNVYFDIPGTTVFLKNSMFIMSPK